MPHSPTKAERAHVSRPSHDWRAGGLSLALCGGLLANSLVPFVPAQGLTAVSLATAVGLCIRFGRLPSALHAGLAGLATVSALAWLRLPAPDLNATEHQTGLLLGLWSTLTVASFATTRSRLTLIAGGFALAGTLAVAIGLAGTSINSGKFVGVLRELPAWTYSWLPERKLRLPGLESSGFINPNALGGLAVIILPVTLGLGWEVRRRTVPCGGLILAVALAGCAASSVALLVTRARGALLATLVTGILVWLWYRRPPPIAAAVVCLSVALTSVYVATYDGQFYLVRDSFSDRMAIWRLAVDAWASSPLMGLGMNQFHHIPNASQSGFTTVAHAHNTFLQVAVDLGAAGLAPYVLVMGAALALGLKRTASHSQNSGLALGLAGSLVAVHLFGLVDAIALGSRVGVFVWLVVGLAHATHEVANTAAPSA